MKRFFRAIWHMTTVVTAFVYGCIAMILRFVFFTVIPRVWRQALPILAKIADEIVSSVTEIFEGRRSRRSTMFTDMLRKPWDKRRK